MEMEMADFVLEKKNVGTTSTTTSTTDSQNRRGQQTDTTIKFESEEIDPETRQLLEELQV